MILFSGYPDTTVTFADFAKRFEDKFHVVRIAYPDLDQKELRRYWGYSMDEIVDALAVVVREYTDSFQGKTYDDSQTPPPIYMVGHDWGSMIAQKYISKYPNGVRKAVLEDVGVVYPNPMDTPLTTLLGIMSYHTYLTFLFILSRIVGNDSWTTWFHFLFALYPWWLIGPLKTVRCTTLSSPLTCCFLNALTNGKERQHCTGVESYQSCLATSVLSILSKHDRLCGGEGNDTPVRVDCPATLFVRRK